MVTVNKIGFMDELLGFAAKEHDKKPRRKEFAFQPVRTENHCTLSSPVVIKRNAQILIYQLHPLSQLQDSLRTAFVALCTLLEQSCTCVLLRRGRLLPYGAQ
eukprot:TRINITY_DN7001_c0_g3_i1.p1 TRINITY_DN7001_c0_g3~~TRINITY_DN7001_c0_g3_i1.p1  ORF type:complete len:102 (+),score=9.30 TRINITY_DN7001_c0_g3_i1:86-391(+)